MFIACMRTTAPSVATALLTAEWKVKGSIPYTGPILSVLKKLGNEETSLALQMAFPPPRGSSYREK